MGSGWTQSWRWRQGWMWWIAWCTFGRVVFFRYVWICGSVSRIIIWYSSIFLCTDGVDSICTILRTVLVLTTWKTASHLNDLTVQLLRRLQVQVDSILRKIHPIRHFPKKYLFRIYYWGEADLKSGFISAKWASRSLNGNLLARSSLKCIYVNYKHKTLDTVFKSISVGHLNFRHNIIPLSIVPWLRANPVEHRAEMNTARTVVSNIWYSSPPNWRPVCSDTLVQQITGNYNTTHINQFSSSFI